MATHSGSTVEPSPASPHGEPSRQGQLVGYEAYIEAQLRKTGSHVRGVDVLGSLLTLLAATLGYGLFVALLDHWIMPGGLGAWGRWALLLMYGAAVVYFLAIDLVPLLFRTINPLYAAQTIERGSPGLKNGLVNFLWFRANPGGLSPRVYEIIEEQAATGLAHSHAETAVDRSKLIRMGYLLAGILLVGAGYKMLSPKDPFQTLGRVLMPWADIAVPTRAAIVEIEPGDVLAFRGQQVTVKARVQGASRDAPVTLFYSTADGQIVDRAVEMRLPSDGYKFEAVLPASDAALQQSLTYRIEAADARTNTYKVEVAAAPTVVVSAVNYKYPAYTGLQPRRGEHQGDLKAIEGTEITLEALANREIDAAHVDFKCDRKLDLRMRSEKDHATATFRLALDADRRAGQYDCYQLLFKTSAGQDNPRPIRHLIEVTRDLSPQIQFLSPTEDEVDVPLNEALDLEVVANDPDFALRGVSVVGKLGKRTVFEQKLLDEVRRGQFSAKYRFEPSARGLAVGDIVEISALAEDNKEPQANISETSRRRIRIVAPSDRVMRETASDNAPAGAPQAANPSGDAGQAADGDLQDPAATGSDRQPSESGKPTPASETAQASDSRAEENSKSDETNDAGQGAGDSGQPSKATSDSAGGQQGDGSQPSTEEEPAIASDGSNDADAIEEILKHQEAAEKTASPAADPADKQPSQGQQPSDDKPGKSGVESGDKQGDGQKAGSPAKKQDTAQGSDGSDKSDGSGTQDKSPDATDAQQQPPSAPANADEQPGAGEKPAGAKPNDAKPADGGKKPNGDKSRPKSSQDSNQQGQKSQPDGNQPPEKGQQGQGEQGKGQQEKGQQGKGSAGQQGDSPENQAEQGQGQQGEGSQGQGPAGQNQQGQQQGKSGQDNPGSKAGNGNPSEGQSDKANDQDGGGSKGKPGDKSAQGGQESGDASPSDASSSDDKTESGTGQKPTAASSTKGKSPDKSADPDSANNTPDGQGQSDAHGKGANDPAGQQNPSSPTSADAKGTPEQSSRKSSPGKQTPPAAAGQHAGENKPDSSAHKGSKPHDQANDGQPGERESDHKSANSGVGQGPSSDNGTGQSEEAGQGENSNRPGQDRESATKTGQPGSKSGPGSTTRQGSAKGESPTDATDSSKKADAASDSTQGNRSSQGGKAPTDGKGSAGATGSGGGEPSQEGNRSAPAGDGSASEPAGDTSAGQGGQEASANGSGQIAPDGRAPGNAPAGDRARQPSADVADKANLEYARQATDLALNHLKDELQKDQPDPQLLKRLGWSRDELEGFVNRWEQMRAAAKTNGEQGSGARRELDESLRSLGLQPRATSLKSNTARDDSARGYQQSGRVAPPPDLADPYKAYLRGTARGGK